MGNEITMNKTTMFLLAGLFLAIVVGGYVVFGQGSATTIAPSQPAPDQPGAPQAPAAGVQDVYLKATAGGYDKSEITVKNGIPVRFHFTAQNAGCGSQLIIYGMNVKVISQNGQENVVEFTPNKEGTFEYNCGMKMFPPGKFVVTA
jgi:heme/copper-type cytochrome/quinol oxidase subunit 2